MKKKTQNLCQNCKKEVAVAYFETKQLCERCYNHLKWEKKYKDSRLAGRPKTHWAYKFITQ